MKKYIISFLQEGKASLELEAKTFSQAVQHAIAIGADLRYADFSFTRLSDVVFANMDLSGANFEYCTLNDCSFKKANLSDVNFSYAGFWETSLSGACCDRTDFFYSSFVACDMSEAKLLLSRNLLMAVFGNLYDAILPQNFTPVCPR